MGGYAIVPVFADPNGSLINYTVTTYPGILTVTSALLVVTIDDFSRSYGSANAFSSFHVTGLVNGETQAAVVTGNPGLATLATATSPVGTYGMTATSGSLSAANYTFSFASGTLTVAPALLTGQVGNAVRFYERPTRCSA